MSGFSSAAHPPIPHLPLVTLYVTDRCNSRCRSCDYWRHGRTDLSLEAVRRLLPSLQALGTRIVQLSGGEPLMSPEWPEIAATLRAAGLEVWLLTAGLALAKSACKVRQLIDSVTVSLDGADAATYAAIRGLDAFDKVCEGIRAVAAQDLAP
ncbi:MAG TPA: radical SAM protein, partial [Steroidobacteraceae bacterium]|nr:radical SAM protein [Steroidobacteraceae bacterium]